MPQHKDRFYQEKAPGPSMEMYRTLGQQRPTGAIAKQWHSLGKIYPKLYWRVTAYKIVITCKTRVLLAILFFKWVSKNNTFSPSKCIASRVKSGFLNDHAEPGLLFSQRWRLGGESKRAVMSLSDSSFHLQVTLSTWCPVRIRCPWIVSTCK